MDSTYILFIAIIGIVIAVGVGLELSSGIDEFVISILFWMLYIITIITFINIFLVSYYYLNMKDKTGPIGNKGPVGDRGEKGDTGLCDATCRDNVCEKNINNMIIDELKKKQNGVAVYMNNVYIKSKIRQMCSSKEFTQLSPTNGPYNLINYLNSIWKIWFELLYSAGGLKYFENIGAESEFEWVSANPFDELKKYDVFYWGMGNQFRPNIIDKCYPSHDGVNPNNNTENYILRISASNYYDTLGNGDGTSAYSNVSFWRAKQFTYKGNVFYPVGDVAIGPNRDNDNTPSTRMVGNYQITSLEGGPQRKTIIVSGDVKSPVDYELIWSNKNYCDNPDSIFWVWRPIPPPEFRALGDVVTFTSDKPNTGDSAPIRCVPKSITVKINPNGNILWSSNGSKNPTNLLLLGYVPNNGDMVPANPNYAYNLFRAVIGTQVNIPATDINANFYNLDPAKYDSQFSIGGNEGTNSNSDNYNNMTNPDTSSNANLVGKGYLPSEVKDKKYSVLAYINLKSTAILTHNISKYKLKCTLIPNAISNAYLIKKPNGKCIDYTDKGLDENECDEIIPTQIFSIIFTGNKKNECYIQHYNTKKIIKYIKNSLLLVDETDKHQKDYTIFMMD
jgi:hypothetical protein